MEALENNEVKYPHCGSTDFYVHEFEYWKASVNDDGCTIDCWHRGNGIDLVQCTHCEADITTDILSNTKVKFNFG